MRRATLLLLLLRRSQRRATQTPRTRSSTTMVSWCTSRTCSPTRCARAPTSARSRRTRTIFGARSCLTSERGQVNVLQPLRRRGGASVFGCRNSNARACLRAGILAVFAVRAGAARVYAVEASDMAERATKLLAFNGFGDKITVIKGKVCVECGAWGAATKGGTFCGGRRTSGGRDFTARKGGCDYLGADGVCARARGASSSARR